MGMIADKLAAMIEEMKEQDRRIQEKTERVIRETIEALDDIKADIEEEV